MNVVSVGSEAKAWVGHEEMTGAGPSYRQVDHWTRLGYLKAVEGFGTGHARRWPVLERDVAAMMHRLAAVGIPPKVAHDDCGLGSGIRVVVAVAAATLR